eukprot:TRINITY_DN22527_c0_g1_i1.p1 TRINITY_DN22527_c0_g1~~TRINITY_DN22527_c0_g1_i1.p1  ORF type:complete len:127 (-),score=21.17 TRINITY_DN22527_c0_g1_i1:121-501(-)
MCIRDRFMDSIGSVGYDMSCVKFIIVLEPVHERDAWRQLLSRARRMGADIKQQIQVATLVYEGSAEELLLQSRCPHAWQTLESQQDPDAKSKPSVGFPLSALTDPRPRVEQAQLAKSPTSEIGWGC